MSTLQFERFNMQTSYPEYLSVLRKNKNLSYRFAKQKSNGLVGFKPNREIYVTSKSGKEVKLVFEMESPFRALVSAFTKDSKNNDVSRIYANNTEGLLPMSTSIYKKVTGQNGDVVVYQGTEIAHRRNSGGKIIPFMKRVQNYISQINEKGFSIYPPAETKYL